MTGKHYTASLSSSHFNRHLKTLLLYFNNIKMYVYGRQKIAVKTKPVSLILSILYYIGWMLYQVKQAIFTSR